MKKIFALLLVLLLLPLSAAFGEEEIIINNIANPSNSFAFPEEATLLEVYFPKIHGCDAAFVRYGEYSMLIDCAGNQWRDTKAMLDKLKITEMTYALNSHPDADHIGGFNHVLKEIPAQEFLLGFPEDYPDGDTVRFKVYNDLHTLGVPFRRVADGDTIAFGDVKMTVYQRTDESLARVNNKSVMVKIELGNRSILFTGDVQRDAQLLFIQDQPDIQSDILKFPHHGYNDMQPDFLSLVDPELVIVTSGRSSANGAKQLNDQKITHYFTENGILRLATDGTVWMVERIK
ncbi:MAG: MBL fold metallo-hydrolase [Clostridia bacterium]|nr:MBL fold metallo-hydrolase [Clostridia bacterium]